MLAILPRTLHHIRVIVAFCLLTCGLLAGPLALTAHAEGNAATFIAEGNLARDGTLKVKQTITLTGAVPPELSQRFETREDLVGDRQYVRTLSDITATVKGAEVTADDHDGGSLHYGDGAHERVNRDRDELHRDGCRGHHRKRYGIALADAAGA